MDRMPRIGITCDFTTSTDTRGGRSAHHTSPAAYAWAVSRAGGLPWLIPSTDPKTPAWAAELDGLIVTGGAFDIPPAYYGQKRHARLGTTLPERSAFERFLLEACLEAGRPVLAICGGMQLLNVLFGGTLYQDLSLRPGRTDVHEQPALKSQPSHDVVCTPQSRAAKLFASERIAVNSTHHQVIDRVGKGLTASGHAPDGVIEIIERPALPFVMGLQWHPEAMLPWEQPLNAPLSPLQQQHLEPYLQLVTSATQQRPAR